MAQIIRTIDNAIFGYDPQAFMPIRDHGRLANKGEFALYKLQRLITKRSVY